MNHHPGAPGFPYSGHPLDEVLVRLDRLERKIDWIAANSDLRQQVPEAAAHPGPQAAPATSSASHAPAARQPSATSAAPVPPGLAARQAVAPSLAGAGRQMPVAAASAFPVPTPVAAAAPPRPQPLGGGPGSQVPQAHAGAAPGSLPGAHRTGQGAAANTGQGPAPAPQAVIQNLAEGNLGRYVLSGAAALLVVLAAVSLIALVWDQVPDVLKVLGISIFSLVLVGAGVRLSQTRPRQQVAAATLTGTGGALGFVSIIGGVLLNGVIPTYPAFALMALWSFALLLVSKYLKQVFTAVISTIGALVTVGFATSYAHSHPGAALVVWALVTTYLVGLAAMTVVLARSASSLTWATWYPTTARVVTYFAVPIAPLYPLLEEHGSSGLLVLLVAPAVLYAQTALDSPQLWRRGHQTLAGAVWAVSALFTFLLAYRCMLYYGTGIRLAAAASLSLLVMHTLAVLVTLLPWTPTGWLQKTCVFLLGSTFALVLINVLNEPKMLAVYVLALIPAALACGRQGQALGALLPLSLPPLVLLTVDSTGAYKVSDFLAAVLLMGMALVADALRPPTAPAAPSPAPGAAAEPGPGAWQPAAGQGGPLLPLAQVSASAPVRAHEQGRLPLQIATFLLAADLVLVLPFVLSRLLPLQGDDQVLAAMVQASVTLIVLLYLGLTGAKASPWELLRGQYRGLLPGADQQHRPLTPGVPGASVLAITLLVMATLANLLYASYRFLPARALLVLTAVALTASAVRFLKPWIRQTGPALFAAALGTFVFLCCLNLLTNSSATGVMTTVSLLVTGACCILLGFRLGIKALRHYGLALVLLSVFKLALTDLVTSNSIFRVLALLAAGVVCFLLSLAYNKIAGDSQEPQAAAASAPLGAVPGGNLGPGGLQVPYGQVPGSSPASPQGHLQAPGVQPVPARPPAVGYPALDQPQPGQPQPWQPHDPRQGREPRPR